MPNKKFRTRVPKTRIKPNADLIAKLEAFIISIPPGLRRRLESGEKLDFISAFRQACDEAYGNSLNKER